MKVLSLVVPKSLTVMEITASRQLFQNWNSLPVSVRSKEAQLVADLVQARISVADVDISPFLCVFMDIISENLK